MDLARHISTSTGLCPAATWKSSGGIDLGTWILIRAIGGTNPCWVKASLMDIKGDVMDVAPTYIALPQSPYYEPPRWVQATRDGDQSHRVLETGLLSPRR